VYTGGRFFPGKNFRVDNSGKILKQGEQFPEPWFRCPHRPVIRQPSVKGGLFPVNAMEVYLPDTTRVLCKKIRRAFSVHEQMPGVHAESHIPI
jgi:hypothetical protein